jgi:hypothetical protein
MDDLWRTEEIPLADRPRLVDAVSRLVDPDGPLRWRTEPARIEVLRRLSGLGGAVVLHIAVYWHARPTLRVVKIGPAEEMRREYNAHETVATRERNILFTPIETATLAARQPVPTESDQAEAVVYQDVGQYVGRPGAPVTTLEDIFAAASRGDSAAAERATVVIRELFQRARESLYLEIRTGDLPVSLRAENTRLGPDITVEPDSGAGPHSPRWPKDLFEAGTADPWEPPNPHMLQLDELIQLQNFEPRDKDRTRLAVNTDQHVSAAMVPAPAGTTFPLSGRVVATRPQTARKRILRHLAAHEPSVRRALAALRPALSEIYLPAISSAVHGDLNSRNILLVDEPEGTDPYLIDYARARPDGSLLSDVAWLEINLIRAVEGDLGLVAHLRLQRFLTATAWLFTSVTGSEPEPVPDGLIECLRAASERLAACWPVLHRLRWESFLAYPEASRDAWFTDYLRHLIVAAHRTFKWPDQIQTPARWTASTAVAAVAGEWLGDNVLQHWDDDELAALAAGAPGSLGRAGAAWLLGTLSSEIDRRTASGTPPAGSLVEAANAVAADLTDRCPAADVTRPFLELRAEVVTADGTAVHDNALAGIGAHDFVVLAGPYGSGKTTVVAELADRMTTVARNRGNITGSEWHRLPVRIPLSALNTDGDGIESAVGLVFAESARDLLRAGCLHLFIDGAAAPDVDRVALGAAIRRRYPRTPVLVTSRTVPDGYTDAACTVIRLHAPTTVQAISFLTEMAAHRGIPVSAVRRLLTGPTARRTDELLHLPMLLRILGEDLRPDVPAPGIGDLLDRHFAGRGAAWDRACRAAGQLAAHLLDQGAEAVSDAAAWLDAADRAEWPAQRDLLVEQHVLCRTAAGTGFTRPVFRDYFAATTIDEDSLPERARRLAWQEPLRIAVSRQASPAGLLAAILPLVEAADPVFAGRLLNAGLELDHVLISSFVARHGAVLADPQAGVVGADRAAAALLALGAPGHKLLCGVAVNERYEQSARLTALRVLGSAGQKPDEMFQMLRVILSGPIEPADLRVAAVTVAGRLQATQLAVLAADRCDDDAPWIYVQAAHAALTAMGVVPSPKLTEARRAAARRRLDDATRSLPELTIWDSIDLAQRDREEVLTRILGDEHDRQLSYRFAFGLDEAVGNALERTPGEPPADVARLLSGAADEAELLVGFGDSDDRRSTAAAHTLLRTHPDRAGALVAAVTATDPPARLLAAAAAAHVSGPASLPYVEELARVLADRPGDDTRTEALAALIWAVSRLDEARGAHLAWYVRAALLAADDSRHLHWPISTVIAKSTPSPALRERLLTSPDPGDRAVAMTALAAQGFHLDAAPPPTDTGTEPGRQALRAARPTPEASWVAVEFVRACATARLVDALDLIRDLLDLGDLGTMVRDIPHGRYGVLSLTGLSEVLSAAGFLAREALATGDPTSMDAATSVAARIESLDPAGLHPSVAAGRLIALGYLGDPAPLLDQLDGAEPRLQAAATHAVLRWARTETWRDPQQAADAIARHLYGKARSGVARSTLLTILDALCRRSGRLPAPPVTDPCE